MKQNKAYKFRIYPNKEQETLILKTFGCTRFIYNQVLGYKRDLYEHTGKSYSKFDAMKDFTEIKKLGSYSWLKEVDSVSLQQSLTDLETSFNNFFRHHKGFPKFKKKNYNASYRTIYPGIKVDFVKKLIKLPKLGLVKYRDARCFSDKIKSVTISKNPSGEYYCSILVEYDFTPNLPTTINIDKVFSADMSAKQFMISEEKEFENQKFFRNQERRLCIRQRRLSKKMKGSSNRQKAKLSVAKIYRNITNRRRGYQRNIANDLVKNYDVLCFESLNIKGMQKFNIGLAKTVSMDFSWSEFLGFLQWKAFKENKYLVKIDKWFPSSKMCNSCGTIKEDLKLSDRVFKCECGYVEDRDLNAAKNIKVAGVQQLQEKYKGVNLLRNPTDLMSESYACGDMTKVTRSAQESTSWKFKMKKVLFIFLMLTTLKLYPCEDIMNYSPKENIYFSKYPIICSDSLDEHGFLLNLNLSEDKKVVSMNFKLFGQLNIPDHTEILLITSNNVKIKTSSDGQMNNDGNVDLRFGGKYEKISAFNILIENRIKSIRIYTRDNFIEEVLNDENSILLLQQFMCLSLQMGK